jgi:hypothetical protein
MDSANLMYSYSLRRSLRECEQCTRDENLPN